MLQLPNILTLCRIFSIPLIIVFLYLHKPIWDWMALLVFIAACVTDFFDGHLARKRDQMSEFGKFLDPIADKLLVSVLLFMLVSKDYIYGITLIPALIILCREIVISGLREYLAGANADLPVTYLAKWKTTVQMIALGLLIVGPSSHSVIFFLGQIVLWFSAVLTCLTGYVYLIAGIKKMKKSNN